MNVQKNFQRVPLTLEQLECRQVFASIHVALLSDQIGLHRWTDHSILQTIQLDLQVIGKEKNLPAFPDDTKRLVEQTIPHLPIHEILGQADANSIRMMYDNDSGMLYQLTVNQTWDPTEFGKMHGKLPAIDPISVVALVAVSGSNRDQYYITTSAVISEFSPLDTDVELEMLLDQLAYEKRMSAHQR